MGCAPSPKFVGLGQVAPTDPAYLLGQLSTATLLHNMQVNLPAATQQAAQQVSNALGLDPQSAQALLEGSDQTIASIAPIAQDAIQMAQSGTPITWMEIVGTSAAVVAMINPAAGAAVALVGGLVQELAGVFGDKSPFFGGQPVNVPTTPVNISMFNFIVRYQNLLEQQGHVPKGPGDDGVGPGHYGGWIHVLDPINPLARGPAWFLVTDIGGDFSIPSTTAYFYYLPDNALFWMFGVVMDEIDAMGTGPYSQEQLFRRYVYSLLLKNWEARINDNVSVDDRVLVLGAASIWNAHHASSSTATYGPIGDPNLMSNLVPNALASQNGGFCHWFYRVDPSAQQFAINFDPHATADNPNQLLWLIDNHTDVLQQVRGKFSQFCVGNVTNTCSDVLTKCASRSGDPGGWASIDLTWAKSHTFLEFLCSSVYDQWPFSNQYPAAMNAGGFQSVGPFTVNTGGPITSVSRTTMAVNPGVQSLLASAATTQMAIGARASAAAQDAATAWAWRLGVSASFATAALYWYAHNHHLSMRQAAQQLARRTKQRIGKGLGRRRR